MNVLDISITRDELALIPISLDNKEDVFREFTDDITRYMFPSPSENIDGVEAFIGQSISKMKSNKDIQLVLINTTTQEFLGCVGLHNIDTGTPEFGLWVKESAHGNRYGRRAIHMLYDFACVNFDFLSIKYPVDRDNIPSRRIPESLGGTIVKEYEEISTSGHILHLVEFMIPIK